MNFIITLEALKFYKLKSEKTVQRLFISLFILNAGIWFLPFVDPDFSSVYNSLNDFASGQVTPIVLTRGNIIFLGLSLVVQLINFLLIFVYAAMFVGEKNSAGKYKLGEMSKFSLPRLLILIGLLIVPAVLSAFLFMIPLIIFVFMMYFLPLNMFIQKKNLSESMQLSFEQTKGARLMIFFQVLFLSLILTLPESLLLSIISNNFIATIFIQSFFTVYLTLSQGRLMGIYYLYLVKKDPVVVPSIPNNQDKGEK